MPVCNPKSKLSRIVGTIVLVLTLIALLYGCRILVEQYHFTVPKIKALRRWEEIEPTLRTGDLILYSEHIQKWYSILGNSVARFGSRCEWTHVSLVIVFPQGPVLFHMYPGKYIKNKVNGSKLIGFNTFKHEMENFWGYVGVRRIRNPLPTRLVWEKCQTFGHVKTLTLPVWNYIYRWFHYRPVKEEDKAMTCIEMIMLLMKKVGLSVEPYRGATLGDVAIKNNHVWEDHITHLYPVFECPSHIQQHFFSFS